MEKDIGDNIRKFRELKNISVKTFASELGLSVSSIGKIERGEVDLTISRLKQIADILETDYRTLMNFDVSQIFNLSNNKLVQGTGAKAENMHFHNDDFKEKYIKMLEDENARLKSLAKEK